MKSNVRTYQISWVWHSHIPHFSWPALKAFEYLQCIPIVLLPSKAFPRYTTPNQPLKWPSQTIWLQQLTKLSDFNIEEALQILSGDSSFLNPNEESFHIHQQKHSQALVDLKLSHSLVSIPHLYALVKYMLQSLPSHMVIGQAQKAWGHSIWKTEFLSLRVMPTFLQTA